MNHFSDLYAGPTVGTALYNFTRRFGFRQTTYMHNPLNRNWTFTHIKNFNCKTRKTSRSEHCKTLTQKMNSVACKPSTVCTLTRHNAGGRAMERRGSEWNKRTHTHTWVYCHSYWTHIHHTNNLSNQQQSMLKPLLKPTIISVWHFWFS